MKRTDKCSAEQSRQAEIALREEKKTKMKTRLEIARETAKEIKSRIPASHADVNSWRKAVKEAEAAVKVEAKAVSSERKRLEKQEEQRVKVRRKNAKRAAEADERL